MVDGVSFSLNAGEILGLGGLVGAGRSEVLGAIYGRLPHTGQIVIAGREVHIRSPRDARAAGIGLLTEERKHDGLLFNFAIRENITLSNLPSVSNYGVLSARREAEVAREYSQRLAVKAPSIRTMVANLSGGNQQKVILARVLLGGPRVLLLDEPTKGVDIGAKQEIYRLIVELAGQGIGIVLVSSELPELLSLSDRFVVLAAGKKTAEFSRAEASEERLMLAATHAV